MHRLALLLLHLLLALPLAHASSRAHILIVGAGTAGCPLAARLCAALPDKRITLLERAAPRSAHAQFIVSAPRMLYSTWTSDELLERFDSLVNPALNRSHQVLTGATLGGTSTVSGMQWTVPLNGSVDRWHIAGLHTASAVPYFQRAYRALSVSRAAQPLRYAADYVAAAQRAGFELSTHHLDGLPRSVWHNRLTIDRQLHRVDACSAYLPRALSGACAHNLRLVQNVTATRLLFARAAGRLRAVGVRALQKLPDNRTRERVFVGSEQIILSAGPYGSAKLLQLSGIGPRQVLQRANVSVRLELPVGQQTQCRASIGISSVYHGVANEPVNNFSLVNDAQQRARWERGEHSVLGTPVSAANGRVAQHGYFGASFVPFWPDVPELYSYCHANAHARGFMHIRDNDPLSAPLVQNNLLGTEADWHHVRQCLAALMRIHRSFPARFNMSLSEPRDARVSDEWIRGKVNTGAHFVGACAVGDVLDERLRVKGVQALRVIDSSVMRELPTSAGPMASVVMIAEYMSELIANECREHGCSAV
eukprot:TRINITY_DN210_c0_g5_i1.p1 TRINITY_DN210_c0_g5~~TRINITY_DN210_c0_g5_i1.p1  ORF type:complete len:536 (-),score=124.61 TRINITY_DN210_c0_g5_i1:276-1883(-)